MAQKYIKKQMFSSMTSTDLFLRDNIRDFAHSKT